MKSSDGGDDAEAGVANSRTGRSISQLRRRVKTGVCTDNH